MYYLKTVAVEVVKLKKKKNYYVILGQKTQPEGHTLDLIPRES